MKTALTAAMAFANTLRARPGTVVLSSAPDAIVVRVQAADVWDAVRVQCAPSDSVAAVKQAAMAVLLPDVTTPADYCVKVRGALVEPDTVSVAAAGVRMATTLLVAPRRRQPIL